MQRKGDNRPVICLMFLAGVFAATSAAANVPMLPFFALVRLSMWWLILLAVLIEAAALRWFFAVSWRDAAWLSVAVNAISLGCGVLLYPLVGAFGYAALGDWVVQTFGAGSTVELMSLSVGAAVVDAIVELTALRIIWGIRANPGQALAFLAANLMSAGLLIGVMAWEARVPALSAEDAATVQSHYAGEIAYLRQVLHDLPHKARVTETDRGYSLDWADEQWLAALKHVRETTRIRNLSLSTPPGRVIWFLGSTSLDVTQRRTLGDLVIEKGETLAQMTVAGHRTFEEAYRLRLTLDRDGVAYQVTGIVDAPAE